MARPGFNDAALWIAVALGFSIPVSTALDSVLMVALLVCWAAGGPFREKWAAVRGNAVALAACACFLLHVAGSAYGLGSAREGLYDLDKAAVLLLVPILVSLQPGVEGLRRAAAAPAPARVRLPARSRFHQGLSLRSGGVQEEDRAQRADGLRRLRPRARRARVGEREGAGAALAVLRTRRVQRALHGL